MRILIAAPFLLVMVLFALSNPQNVSLRLWPTDLAMQAPLSLIVLVSMGFGGLIGALALWFSAIGARMRARRAEATVRRQDAQMNNMRSQTAVALPPPA